MLISPIKSQIFTGKIKLHLASLENRSGKFHSQGDSFIKSNSGLLEGQILESDGQIFNRHSTNFFRHDIDWTDLGNYLKENFKNDKKVNTYVWACSTGEEAYSIALLLKSFFGEDAKKFIPVRAMDIDSKIINRNRKQQKEGIYIDEYVLSRILLKFKLKYKQYVNTYIKEKSSGNLLIAPDITKMVSFKFSNILTDVNKIDSKNPSLIMCRNMWPYVDSKKYDEFAKKLYKKLAPNSLVIIGGYDWEGDSHFKNSNTFGNVLEKNGFKPVMEKAGLFSGREVGKCFPLVFKKED